METKLVCCTIGCEADAEFAVFDPARPYDETHACAAHVKEMAGDGDVVTRFRDGAFVKVPSAQLESYKQAGCRMVSGGESPPLVVL